MGLTLVSVFTACMLAACSGEIAHQEPAAPLHILAAASLSNVLPEMLLAVQETRHAGQEDPGHPSGGVGGDTGAGDAGSGGAQLRFHFGATSRLARQASAGAPGDLFFSADAAWMDWLVEAGQVQAGTVQVLASNQLVVIVPVDTASVPADLAALAANPPEHMALAGEAVPAGRYAREALSQDPAWATLSTRVVNGSNVRTALEWVATGETRAGVVYATDARLDPRVRVAFSLPSPTPIVYTAAVLRHSPNPKAALDLLDRVASPEGRAALESHGFTPPPGNDAPP